MYICTENIGCQKHVYISLVMCRMHTAQLYET